MSYEYCEYLFIQLCMSTTIDQLQQSWMFLKGNLEQYFARKPRILNNKMSKTEYDNMSYILIINIYDNMLIIINYIIMNK